MITIAVTLVRLKENKEPVAVFDKVDDIVLLGQKIDEITDPASCEYCDYELCIELSLLFTCNIAWPIKDDEDSIVDHCRIGSEFGDSVQDAFLDESIEWAELPESFDYLSTNLDINDRFFQEEPF